MGYFFFYQINLVFRKVFVTLHKHLKTIFMRNPSRFTNETAEKFIEKLDKICVPFVIGAALYFAANIMYHMLICGK
jgi:hypothetical protein